MEPLGARGRHLPHRASRQRLFAPAATDRFAPARHAVQTAARQRLRLDAENFGGEVSLLPFRRIMPRKCAAPALLGFVDGAYMRRYHFPAIRKAYPGLHLTADPAS